MVYFTKRFHPPGTAPGTLIEPQRTHIDQPTIRIITYNPDDISINESASVEECQRCLGGDCITWVHVQGHPTKGLLAELGSVFQLHSLALEDVMNVGQRPKMDLYDDQVFVVMSLPTIEKEKIRVRQVSMFLNDNCLISFCEGDMAPFDPVIKRLQDKASRVRRKGADFMLYSLLDMIIDHGFPVLESFGQQLDYLEEEILKTANKQIPEKIHTLKRDLIILRRMLWPQREVVNQLLREDTAAIEEGTAVYLRDCYDHCIQVMDLLETYRDMSGSMLEIYLSSVSNHMNEIMRVLTVIATLFIPLTFIVGLYGMNFDRAVSPWNMPELGWAYGYPLLWLVMLITTVVMLLFFRRRNLL